ncbi:Ribonuclease H1 [Eumeta japonica]|uniref:Ribonuclease H n=1 Tax=Eumeta variegata TaxID=151549 RepID=A0A4C1TXA9_EUMVA|nr:Ribonuclease H1 [Eumeta japonica]
MPFYAVAKGRTPGIFMTWPDCENQVKGFPGAKYKKFDSVVQAQEFININGNQKMSLNTNSNVNIGNKSNNKRSYYNRKSNTSSSTEVPNKKPRTSQSTEHVNNELNKQMDDIEKRLRGVEQNVNRIIENSSANKHSNRKTILIEPPTVKKEIDNSGFEVGDDGYIQVYTDGACSENGKSNARAGLGVFWGENHPLNLSEPVTGRATNNCGEIQAAIRAINQAVQHGISHLAINTDSQFLINSVTKWMPAWKRKGWTLKSGEPVKNQIDFKELDSIKNKLNIKWNYVTAHNGVYGNEMADKLAKEGAAMYLKSSYESRRSLHFSGTNSIASFGIDSPSRGGLVIRRPAGAGLGAVADVAPPPAAASLRGFALC